jgi:O-antigen/teichoic acid export membrane protein
VTQAEKNAETTEQNTRLWAAFTRGVRNNFIAEVAVQALRVGGVVVLARQLSPADFGLLKVLLIVSMFAAIFCESGIPDALIQRRHLTVEHIATAWWLSILLAALTVTSLYVGAPLVARMMAMPGLSIDIRLICLPLFLEGTAIVAVAELSRSLRFGALAIADVVAEVAFLSTALTLVWQGLPAWSLPAGLAMRLSVHAFAIWIAHGRLAIGLPRLGAAQDLGRFAVGALGARIMTVAAGNADFLLVGRLLGASALGYYSIAWDLLRFVPDRLHRVAGRVIFPAFCQVQHDGSELRRAYNNLLNYMGRVILPISGFVAIAAPELLANIYGKQWLPATMPMRLLALGLALAGLRIGFGAVYYAKGYPSIDMVLNGSRLILIVLAVVGTAHLGLVAVSGSVSAVEALISLAGQSIVSKLIGTSLGDLIGSLAPGTQLASVCIIATVLGRLIAPLADLHGVSELLAAAALPALAFVWFEGKEVGTIVTNALRPAPIEIANAGID